MTDDELHSLYADVDVFLTKERAETLRVRAAQHANVEPVSAQEARKVKQLFARGRISGGICTTCGDPKLHAHGIVS